jgi:hypothetical protein
MKLTFSWRSKLGIICPHCSSELVNKDGINILSCLLMDDGGIPYHQSVSWIMEGITRIDSVLNGETISSNWDRESWGALITLDGVKIYSLHDENYFEDITLQQFRYALVVWESFVESEPNLVKQIKIELNTVG